MAGHRNFWPIFSSRPQLIIFCPEKFFFQIRPKFLTSGHIESQNFRQIWQFFDASERIKMVRIWPEIEISGRILVSGQKMHFFLAEKIFWQNGRNFWLQAEFEVEIVKIYTQNTCNLLKNPIFSAFLTNFWYFVAGTWPIHIILDFQRYMYLNKLSMNFGRNRPTYSLCIWPTILENRFFQKMTYFPAGIWPI